MKTKYRQKHQRTILLFLAGLSGVGVSMARGAEVELIKNGQSQCVIQAAPRVLEKDRPVTRRDGTAYNAEMDRRRLRESVRDLAYYLGKMAGAKVAVENNTTGKTAPVVVTVGEAAEKIFEPVGIEAPGKQGYRVVVQKKRVGLYGESDLAASYAVYDILHGLGCRWYMPGKLGEVIPERKTVTLPEQNRTGRPFTLYRTIWYADDDYKRRNRCGGTLLMANHMLEGYVTRKQRDEHSEWRAISKGKTQRRRLKWSMPGVAEAIADGIIAKLDKEPWTTTISLSPDDGMSYDETDDKKLDAGDIDTSIGQVSLTDRLVWLCNRIIERVNKKYPGISYGMLAYGPTNRPPVREKMNPQLHPQIAPITYRRAQPMTDDRVPNNKDLRELIKGWAKCSPEISFYYYGFFLAEPSSPNPFLTKWGIDVPIALKNNCRYWQPETIPNFETTMHALYMGLCLAWDPNQDPWKIYDEINSRFYGHAGAAMKAYWKLVDDTWTGTPEYSGCGFGHMRRFPPKVLAEWREALNKGLAACRTPEETRRVKMADASLRLFESFMKMRRDLAEGTWGGLKSDVKRYEEDMAKAGDKYADNYAFTKIYWAKKLGGSVNTFYFRTFYKPTYDDAIRIADSPKYTILLSKPLREFRYKDDPREQGESQGWSGADFSDLNWPTTDVCVQTWSAIGLYSYLGTVWYRTKVKLGELKKDKPVYLWLGATDGSVKVFVNGKHVPYKDSKGKINETASGYCKPFSFDVTNFITANAGNLITIKATRTFINELGTGGLLAPVTLYQNKE